MVLPERDSGAVWWVIVLLGFLWNCSQKPYGWDLRMKATDH